MSAFTSMAAFAEEPYSGYYQLLGATPDRYQTLTVIATAKGLMFNYITESLQSRCEVPGIATPVPHRELEYLFTDDKDHHLSEGWEGYGAPDESPRCQISLVFTRDQVIVKQLTEYGCRSFCGARGGIGGTLTHVRP